MQLTSSADISGISDISLCRKGDKAAFARIIEQNKNSMYRIAKGILKNEHDVEDALQNAVIKCYNGFPDLKKEEYFKTWMIRILINECNLIIRKNKRIIPMEEIRSVEKGIDSFNSIDLSSAVDSLEHDLRVVTLLYYYEDVSAKDIAKILKINETTVRTRLYRARNKLHEILKEG